MFDVWYCANEMCNYKGEVKKDKSCPQCGGSGKLFGFSDAVKHLNKKEENSRKEEVFKNILFNDTTSDLEIKTQIYRDMGNLASQESGTGIFNVINLLTGTNAEVLMGKALKGIIDQNKIMIRQNELILRELQKGNNLRESH